MQVTQLIEAFNEIDVAIDRTMGSEGVWEHLLLEELHERLSLLLPFVDSVALPRSVLKAGRDVGDFFYLFAAEVNKALEGSEAIVLPTVREVKKYDQISDESLVSLDMTALDEVLIYREKARENLRRPAKRYGLSVDSSFEPFFIQESQS